MNVEIVSSRGELLVLRVLLSEETIKSFAFNQRRKDSGNLPLWFANIQS
jgi:hypothetical protein